MGDFGIVFQKEMRAHLGKSSQLAAFVKRRIYDEPPQKPVYPFVRFGNITIGAFDTDSEEGAEIRFSIEAHSRASSGRVEATKILGAVWSQIHRKQANFISSFNVVEITCDALTVSRNPSGRGHTGTLSANIILTPK